MPSVQFSHSVVSNSLQPQGLQNARLSCISATPGACSNPCPSNQWCHSTISSSVVPVSKAEAPILRPTDVKNWLIEKTLMLGNLKAGGGGDERGWDGCMASLTRWTWVWVNSGSWWSTGKPGVLQSMELQRVRHNWGTKLNWTELKA